MPERLVAYAGALSLAMALLGLWQRRPDAPAFSSLLLLLLLVGGMGVGLVRGQTLAAYSKTRGWRALAAKIEQWAGGVDSQELRVAQNYPDPTLWYYYQGPVDHLVLPPQAGDLPGAEREVGKLAAAGVSRVILARQPARGWDDGMIASTSLTAQYASIYGENVENWRLVQYAASPEALEPLEVLYRSGLILDSYALEPSSFVPGGILAEHVQWRAPEEWIPSDLRDGDVPAVSVQILDANGRLAAQADRALGVDLERVNDARQATASYGILLPGSKAASSPGAGVEGPYRVGVVIYHPDEPGAPRVVTEDGLDWVSLGTIQLEPQEE